MMNRILIGIFTLLLIPVLRSVAQQESVTKKNELLEIIHRVNGYWQAHHDPEVWAFWDVAAYHTGNMAVFKLTGHEPYRQYSEQWALHNEWKGAKSDDKSKWKYHYGESDDFVLFGDWQICFQTYIDLYHIAPQYDKISRAIEVMSHQVNTERDDYWWWADGLYMVMPVMTKLYHITGDTLYLHKLNEYFLYAKALMYDNEECLFYRDAKYVYPGHKSKNGKKDFWVRGDGWVFAGLAKVLDDLPVDAPYRDLFVNIYQDMAKAIAASQQKEGYWTRSMLDPDHAPGPETSGTAFFTYGFLWGINNGYLSSEEYLPVVNRAWHYLQHIALQDDGQVGYVQPIGERAIPGQVVDRSSTANFGVGAFLLAATEFYRYLQVQKHEVKNDTKGYLNPDSVLGL